MKASGILSLFDYPGESGNINTVTVSELGRNYGRVHELSVESGSPVLITRDGEADGVFFSTEAFESLQNDLLRLLEDVVLNTSRTSFRCIRGKASPRRRRRTR